jgi:serine protease Do
MTSKTFARSFTAILAAGASALALSLPATAQSSGSQETVRPPFAAAVPSGAPMSFADLIDRVSGAVVSIEAEGTVEVRPEQQMPQLPPQFREFFGPFGPEFDQQRPRERQRRAQGSGFFISDDGRLVTNNHVVAGADEITITLKDGSEFAARIVGTDEATDLALLQVEDADGRSFEHVTLDSDPDFRVGDWVVAVGNPFGLGGTATAGIISAIGRPIGAQAYTDFIQVDAPINRGNSGGPTFDLEGNVIGVNSAIFSPTGGNVGIGFAIPSDLAANVIAQLSETGVVRRGYLGVQPQTLTADLAEGFGLPADAEGAAIANVLDGTPAARAGLQGGDVIIAVDGRPVTDARELTRRVGAYAPGERVEFTVLREGEERTITVRLDERPTESELAEGGGGSDEPADVFGMALEPADEAARERFEVEGERGLLVSGVRGESEAAEKGSRPGDMILEAGGADVASVADFNAAVAEARDQGRRAVLVLVANRNGGVRYVALQFDKDDEEAGSR